MIRRGEGEIWGWGACLGMAVFALCHGRPMPMALISFGALFATGACVLFVVVRAKDGFEAWGGRLPPARGTIWFLLAVGLGGLVAMAYRAEVGASLFPKALGRFVLPAALIGACEELLYRGFIQTRLAQTGRWSAVAFTSAGHTAYKCLLFVGRPSSEPAVDFAFLATATFLVGLLLGGVRERSGSVWPAVAGHVTFDIMVYGALAAAPWWVWR